jgi:DMSO reductase anchor subunit
MKPAFSVIFFTVSSGAGFGLIALLLMSHIFQFDPGLSAMQMAGGQLLALVLITAGLLSSTLHLANPKNAWRAFSRFKTSWLSREGVFSLLFYPFALASAGLAYFDAGGALRIGIEIATVILAWITLYCTGMIYASLKPIPQWHTQLVPAGYLILGHMSGALLLLAVVATGGTAETVYVHLALAWLVLGAAWKACYYTWAARLKASSTINTALGISRARIRLLDAGHTHGTFLTNEFGFTVARQHAASLKTAVFALAFLLPMLLLMLSGPTLAPAVVAAVLALSGLLVERWLFFAEARHVVQVFHGRDGNPVALRDAVTGRPLPARAKLDEPPQPLPG